MAHHNGLSIRGRLRNLESVARNIVIALVTMVLLAGVRTAQGIDMKREASGMGPEDLVRQTTQRLLTAVRSERETIRNNPKRAHSLVDEIVTPHVDLERVSRWVLGKYWRKAAPAQRKRFMDEFRMLVIRSYATALLDYTDVAITYLSARTNDKGTKAFVRTQILEPSRQAIGVDYRLHRRDGVWKVYDVLVEGISLLTNYRTSFTAEVKRGGIDSLIEQLATKNQGIRKP